MLLNKKIIATVAGAFLATAAAISGAQADETSLANETPVTPETLTRPTTPPTPASCAADLNNAAIAQEQYIFGKTGDGSNVYKSFGYILPTDPESTEEERTYTGCTYSEIEGRNNIRVVGHVDLTDDRNLTRYMNEISQTAARELAQQEREERAAQAEAMRDLTPEQRRCVRAQNDLNDFLTQANADNVITRQEGNRITNKQIKVDNLCPQM